MAGLRLGLGRHSSDAVFGPPKARHSREDWQSDAMEAIACGWLSFVVVVTLTFQWLVGAWWIDGIGSLAIVYFLVKEGREALSGQECASCCD